MIEETLIKETVERRQALNLLLEQMDVPEMRRDTASPANIRWLNRNLGVRNRDNPAFKPATALIRWLLREGWIDTSHIGA